MEACTVLAVSENMPGSIWLIHGFAGHPAQYRLAAEGLREATGITVRTPLIPQAALGSNGKRGAGSIGQTADALAQRLERSAGPVLLIGHSLGGGIAIALAARRPDKVSGLLLASPVGGDTQASLRSWWHMAVASPAETRATRQAQQGRRPERGTARRIGQAWGRWPLASARLGLSAKHSDLTGELAQVCAAGIRVRILVADDDRIVLPGALLDVDGVQVVHVNGAHSWPMTQPAALVEAVQGMLAAHTP